MGLFREVYVDVTRYQIIDWPQHSGAPEGSQPQYYSTTNYQLPITKWPHQSEAPASSILQYNNLDITMRTECLSCMCMLCCILACVDC
jgi:hypothetical protein